MLTSNPFSELSEIIPVFYQQAYVIAMFILVIGGTVIDMLHKKSAQYFFENAEKAKKRATKEVSGGDKVSAAISTVTSEVLTSSEFANPTRRMSHLLTMYGFIMFVASTAILIFSEAPAEIVAVAWHIGAIMLCVGGYWFWFSIRVDVYAEGAVWYKLVKADLFIVSLLLTCSFALIWDATQGSNLGWLMFGLFIASSTVLFGGVIVSKFAHMFFKPAAAYQKKITRLDGSAENLPLETRDDPEQRKRHSMELLVDAPMDMGLGIKRESPNHY